MAETVVCVGGLVYRGNQILLARQSEGHPLQGQWTIPWGRLDKGESPMRAALRETFEEAGITAEIEGFLGVQELPSPWAGWIGLIYLGRHLSGSPEPQDREMDAAKYFSVEELTGLIEPVEPLSAWLAERFFKKDLTVLPMNQGNPLQSMGSFL